MKIYLPFSVFLIIYSYVGHNSLYLDKTYYKYLMTCRKEFVENPITIIYRLCKWKQKHSDIENNYSRKERASMRVEMEKTIDISGNISLGNISEDGELINYSKNLEDSLIPASDCKHVLYPHPYKVIYFSTLYSVRCEDIEKYKKYAYLWVN